MAARYWTCRKCGTRNERTKQKCSGIIADPVDIDCYDVCPGRRPKPRVPKHAVTLRDDSYAHYVQINEAIHAAGETCGVCGTPPKDTRNLQREHDHVTGLPRGLACWRCNRLMPKQFTLVEAQAIVAYLERVQDYYESENTR